MEVQHLAVGAGVSCVSHIQVPIQLVKRADETVTSTQSSTHFLAVATSPSSAGETPAVLIYRWFEAAQSDSSKFEHYYALNEPRGIYASGLAHIIHDGEIWLAVSCFSDASTYPEAAHTESHVYRYGPIFARELVDTLDSRLPRLERVQSFASRGATDVAFWVTPQQHLLLMISNFQSQSDPASVDGDVSVYVHSNETASFHLMQTIAAQGAYDIEVFAPEELGGMLGIANRQVRPA